MNNADAMSLTATLLAAAGGLTAVIHEGVVARGFDDLRPAHGFAFARLAPGGATAADLAEHLGVSRQAASQMVEELVGKGYVERRPHPDDARARLVVLTDRGWACTRAAEAAAADAVRPWAALLGERRLQALRDDLARLAPGGPIRPNW
ncbi:MarR family transcriptional regulator [Streptomyces sp. SID13666]|uniref:MarR family winged helix-turn-helix transcriptional regulator n=1 Tax=Streptomyces TaxID=1883 RepID=UPI0011068CAB|nr:MULTISPECIES: MarR family transcriptional regulator [Streptomyces]MCZ4096617.1 MarR family transcriptional regulator [Streptomyces sp. H39-C1]NEA55875.1 MarR family transcriptional regulator [Streptomyces sp. SID13666]NEA71341.1 MarR family transcriptional regulator [Streptomyces sp. SID13588]QNA72642.1 MarR family transcriptional regulator [Streptomyces sp. So13.3]